MPSVALSCHVAHRRILICLSPEVLSVLVSASFVQIPVWFFPKCAMVWVPLIAFFRHHSEFLIQWAVDMPCCCRLAIKVSDMKMKMDHCLPSPRYSVVFRLWCSLNSQSRMKAATVSPRKSIFCKDEDSSGNFHLMGRAEARHTQEYPPSSENVHQKSSWRFRRRSPTYPAISSRSWVPYFLHTR